MCSFRGHFGLKDHTRFEKGVIQQQVGAEYMDLVVVPGSLDLVSSSEGPVWVWEPGFIDLALLLATLCTWALGFCCGRRSVWRAPEQAQVRQAHPTEPVGRWALIAQRAINFTRSRRRVSVAFAHYGSFSLRNTAGSKPTLKRRSRRSSTPGPVLHEGPALHQDGPHGDRARGHHEFGGSLHLGGGDRSPSGRPPRGFGRSRPGP